MKAITIYQPFASLIAQGFKRYETRGWRTNYRGPIAIHAGKQIDHQTVLILAKDYTKTWHQISPLSTGCVIAIAELVDCWKVLDNHLLEAQPPNEKRVKFLNMRELPFGDYTPGRYAWELANVCRIEPVPVKGQQGLWNWEA